MDGIDQYRGNEFQWAIDTAIECAEYLSDDAKVTTGTDLVEIAWDFISQVFTEEGLTPPEKSQVITAVEQRLKQLGRNE